MFFFKKKSPHSVTVLPHRSICPTGELVPAIAGKSIAEMLIRHDVDISHSCQLQCACTTCHVYVMEGSHHINRMNDEEDRMLKNVPDRTQWSRLACQAVFEGGGDVVVEIRE
jgi:2Fe-2S ferredoxin